MTALIEDRELRDMFRAECTEHAQRIEAGLMALESGTADAARLEEVFREAHSLKGAARMLGLRDIQNLAHDIESLLAEARQGQAVIGPEQIAPQLQRLDRIRELVAVAVGDIGPEQLSPAETPPAAPAAIPSATPAAGPDTARAASPPAPPPPAPPTAQVPAPAPAPMPRAAPPVTGATGLGDFHIDTLRVESARLDRLMQQAAELVVSKGRASRWSHELGELIDRAEQRPLADGGAARLAELIAPLKRLQAQALADSARLEGVATDLEEGIRGLRLVPLSAVMELFPRMVHDLGRELGKSVGFVVDGASALADKRIVEEIKAPLMHLVRNSLDHGIEPAADRERVGKPPQGTVRVSFAQGNDQLQVTVSDDGRGLDLAAIRQQAMRRGLYSADELDHLSTAQLQQLILQPGFSTSAMVTDVSGRGVGLDVVRSTIERLHGTLAIDSSAGQGMSIRLQLPVSLTATRAMLLREWGQTYAVPFDDIAFLKRLRADELLLVEGRHCFYRGQQAIAVERLGLLLDRAAPSLPEGQAMDCVVLELGGERFGLLFDEVIGTEDLVVKPTTPPLTRVRNLAGLAVLNAGDVCPVLNLYDLLRSMNRAARAPTATGADGESGAMRRKRVLLAEDSITTRLQERRILEAAGYEVDTAVDGVEAWQLLASREYDALVSDVQMPRMSGLELAQTIRQHARYAEMPIILVTSLATEADRRRGLEVGADAYITKGDFDQGLLLDCLARLS